MEEVNICMVQGEWRVRMNTIWQLWEEEEVNEVLRRGRSKNLVEQVNEGRRGTSITIFKEDWCFEERERETNSLSLFIESTILPTLLLERFRVNSPQLAKHRDDKLQLSSKNLHLQLKCCLSKTNSNLSKGTTMRTRRSIVSVSESVSVR